MCFVTHCFMCDFYSCNKYFQQQARQSAGVHLIVSLHLSRVQMCRVICLFHFDETCDKDSFHHLYLSCG